MNRPAKNAAGKEKPASKLKIALVGMLAAATGLPLGIGRTDTQRVSPAQAGTPAITRAANETKQAPVQAPATGAQAMRVVRGLDGMDPTPLPIRSGRSPKDWGMSRECARMRRKNRMRSLGISSQRI